MKKILVVEDDPKMIRMLIDALKKEKFETIEATNGEEGLKAALELKPDLILLDLVMPIMDGLEMLNKLRAEDKGKDIPVIILTNSGDFDKIAQAVEKGICSYMVKSDFTIEDLVKRAEELLK
ncbi:MAG: response regulator transcription factor [bacterium]|nr:response regulator transcription factor [bacterium]